MRFRIAGSFSALLLIAAMAITACSGLNKSDTPKCASPEDLRQSTTTCLTSANIAAIFGRAYQPGVAKPSDGGLTLTFIPTVPAYAGPIPDPKSSKSPEPQPSGTAAFDWGYKFRPVVKLAILTGKPAMEAWKAYQKQYPDANPITNSPLHDQLVTTKDGGVAAGCVGIDDAGKAKYVEVSLDYSRVTAKLTDEQKKFFLVGIQTAVSDVMSRFNQ